MVDLITQGLVAALDPYVLALLAGSVCLGILAGALPGISATMGVAVLAPLTFTLDPYPAIVSLLGIYCGAVYGGSISAIVLGIPGTPGAVATTLDGSLMARRGAAGRALGISTISSFLGGAISALALAFLSYPLAALALKFGPREYLAVFVFALAAVANLSGPSFAKGVFSALVGLFLASIGIDETFGTSRFHLGSSYLLGGVSFLPAIIGLFAIPETLQSIEKITTVRSKAVQISRVLPGRAELKRLLPAQLRSSLVGVLVGVVPGTGSDVAAIISYSQGKNWSKNPERFGTGSEEALACAEAGNNGATGGSMIPLLTLGIPGGAVSAIILGVFMAHGLKPGPLLLSDNADLVYKIFVGFFIANIFLLAFGLLGARIFARTLQIPSSILAPVVLLLCIIGAYSIRGNPADIYVMLFIGLAGYAMLKTDIPRAPLVIGLILGPFLESEMTRSALLVDGVIMDLFTPIASIIWLMTIVSLGWRGILKLLKRSKGYFSK